MANRKVTMRSVRAFIRDTYAALSALPQMPTGDELIATLKEIEERFAAEDRVTAEPHVGDESLECIRDLYKAADEAETTEDESMSDTAGESQESCGEPALQAVFKKAPIPAKAAVIKEPSHRSSSWGEQEEDGPQLNLISEIELLWLNAAPVKEEDTQSWLQTAT